MKYKTYKTNVEAVTEYMKLFSPMNQVFVIDAVTKMAEQVVKNEDEVRKAMQGSIVHPDAWIGAAKQWLEQNPQYA